jgi:hypothetical protein
MRAAALDWGCFTDAAAAIDYLGRLSLLTDRGNVRPLAAPSAKGFASHIGKRRSAKGFASYSWEGAIGDGIRSLQIGKRDR